MKKLVLFIGVLILLSSNSLLLRAEDNSIIQEDNKVWTVSSECEIKEVENGLLYIENNSIKYIYRNQEICCIQEDYLAHVVDSNYLYLVTNNNGLIYLRSIKLDDKKESITLINMNICSQISIIDNELILVGSSNNDASITRYTKKLSLIYEYKYGGIGNEEFLKMYYFDNKYDNLRGEKLADAIKKEIKSKSADLKGNMLSQGTTPRRYVDLIGSLCDLTSGSGDKGTPVVFIQGYFDNYATEE